MPLPVLSKIYASLLAPLMVLLLGTLPAVALGQALIVESDNPLAYISRGTARAIFSMRLTQWPDGSEITVFVMADQHPQHQSFTRDRLNMFSHQLRRSWDRYVYSGTGSAPIEVSTMEEMRQRVARTPGSIGYISEEYRDASVRSIAIK